VNRSEHQAFLDRYYGASRRIYDLTRKYYLFGRDSALAGLLTERWSRLVEIGPGTGRNLGMLHQGRPSARYGGVDASLAMLEVARVRCPWAAFAHGFAEDADYAALVDGPPDRVLFSYCLSMVQEPGRALAHARSQLSPGGEVVVVDFADLAGLPGPAGGALSAWLTRFHVRPLDERLLRSVGAEIQFGPGRYWLKATIRGE